MLAIDIGNSRIKWGRFLPGVETGPASSAAIDYQATSFEQALQEAGMPLDESDIYISQVAGDALKERLKTWLERNTGARLHFIKTERQTCGVKNAYSEPGNLGVDRWLAMIAAHRHYQTGKFASLCIISCGTAITLDVLTPDGEHQGGLIMPGVSSMLKVLGETTGNLAKFIEQDENRGVEPGKLSLANGSAQGIELGCAQMAIYSLAKMLEVLKQNQPRNQPRNQPGKMLCLFSGGDGQWLSENMPSLAQVVYEFEPHLVLRGLQCVYLNG